MRGWTRRCGSRGGPVSWLEGPPDGTQCCGGLDGSTRDDWTAIKLETHSGVLFTPRYGPDRRPTIWNPDEWGGTIPRDEVHAAWDEINDRYRLERVYVDPPMWESELAQWAGLYGERVFIGWQTYRMIPMHEALDVFVTDLTSGLLVHDGCPITARHVLNARRLARPKERYAIGKPSNSQKIDAAVASVLAHKAAVDARAAGWSEVEDSRVFCFGGFERDGGVARDRRFDRR